MRVLFLDFDGVLNSSRYMRENRRRFEGGVLHRVSDAIDRAAVARLDAVVARTGAKVVISSSWRKSVTLSSLRRLLRVTGFRGEVIGATPILRREQLDLDVWFAPAVEALAGPLAVTSEERRTLRHVERGHEIQRWLSEHPEVTAFAIVDDDTDMAHLYPRLVLTDCEEGLQDQHVEQLVALLTGEP